MKRAVLLLATVSLLLLLAAQTPAKHPNYSGTWKVNPGKTSYGPFPVDKDETLIIGGDSSRIEVTLKSGERVINKAVYIPDGVARTEPNKTGETQVKAYWEGSQLVVERDYKDRSEPRRNYYSKGRWLLSPEGKVLTRSGEFVFGTEHVPSVAVYDKLH